MCVCVCVRERVRERLSERGINLTSNNKAQSSVGLFSGAEFRFSVERSVVEQRRQKFFQFPKFFEQVFEKSEVVTTAKPSSIVKQKFLMLWIEWLCLKC